MRWFHIIMVCLSYLILAAHFLRPGNIFMAMVSLGIPFLILIHRRLILRIIQGGLVFASLIWILSLSAYIQAYYAMGKDMTRMSLILTTVILFNILTIIVTNARSVKEKYIK